MSIILMKSYKKDDKGNLLITAPVMIPNARDCDFENGETPLTKEQIKEFAESYKKYQFIDHEHGLTKNGRKIGTPVKSFLLNKDQDLELLEGNTQTYPAGTWLITTKLTDQEAINTALNGGYTGYSPSILPMERADAYLEALKSDNTIPLPESYKSVSSAGNSLIRDVPNPVVLSISLVKRPCLHQSKFCNLNGEKMEEEISLKSKILTAMGMTEEAEVIALKSEVTELKTALTKMQTDFEESLKSMQEEFKVTLENALKPVEADKSEEEIVKEEPVDEPADEPETKEEEPVAEKGHSKAEPVHDNIVAEKSKPQTIYEALGRNPDGTRKRH